MTTYLCYFRFFRYCENKNLSIKSHYCSAKYTTFIIYKNKKSAILPIDGVNKYKKHLFNNNNMSLKNVIEVFNLDKNEILIECERKKRDEGPIKKYEQLFPKITTFHKHC